MARSVRDRSPPGGRNVHVQSLIENCAFCGAPCLGTYRLWFDDGDAGRGVELDQPALDVALSELLEKAPAGDYSALPAFLRALNEAQFEDDVTEVDGSDLLRAIALLETSVAGSSHRAEVFAALRGLVDEAHRAGARLWFVDD